VGVAGGEGWDVDVIAGLQAVNIINNHSPVG